jgi:hypothetical protein
MCPTAIAISAYFGDMLTASKLMLLYIICHYGTGKLTLSMVRTEFQDEKMRSEHVLIEENLDELVARVHPPLETFLRRLIQGTRGFRNVSRSINCHRTPEIKTT